MSEEIENVWAQIEIRGTDYLLSFSPQPDGAARYQLRLCRKPTTLGQVEIDQFWMPTFSLYGQRNSYAVNQQPIVDLWWAMCGNGGTQNQKAVQESYLLAKILPHARSNGSRRTFLDAIQTVPENRYGQMQVWIYELNQRLLDSCSEGFDEIQFRDATADFIGPPFYNSEVWEKYQEMSERLFGDAHDQIQQRGTQTIESVLQDWETLMRQIGRRRGNSIEKQVLDILSYESRTALHRCYSGVWWEILLPALAEHYHFTDESCVFHQLWHLDRCRESDHYDLAYFHLFHGHIFALHPACGPLLRTDRGQELFGEWLREGTLTSYHRVLHALAVAVSFYAEQHDITKLLRTNHKREISVDDLVSHEEQRVARRSGRRPRHSPDE